MSTSKNQKIAETFIQALERIKSDRGKMAVLRRAVSSQQKKQLSAWPVVLSLGGRIEGPEYVGIAALYALHPENDPEKSDQENFGTICRSIALAASSDRKLSGSFERRFRRLILSDSAGELCEQLRTWIRFAKNMGKEINYNQLFQNMLDWEYRKDSIRLDWASEFWGSKVEAPEQ